jgi:hypothetical protein
MTNEKHISESHDEWLKELKNLSPFLASLKKTNPFKLPGNYFNDSRNSILESIKDEPTIDLQDASKKEFSVPEDYFEGLGTRVFEKIKSEENGNKGNSIIPAQSENPFKVPTSYFDELSGRVMNKIDDKQKGENTRIVNINNSNFRIALSIAAIFLIGIFTLLFFVRRNQVENPGIALNNISNKEIQSYLIENIGEIEEETIYSSIDDIDAILGSFIDNAFESIEFTDEEMDDFIINQIDEEYL